MRLDFLWWKKCLCAQPVYGSWCTAAVYYTVRKNDESIKKSATFDCANRLQLCQCTTKVGQCVQILSHWVGNQGQEARLGWGSIQ